MVDRWRPVVGFEGLYEVSDRGCVRRATKTTRGEAGRHLKPALNHSGYPVVALSKHGKLRSSSVHKLVALAFIGPCPEGNEINHKDADKENACVGNLEYVTRAENMQHAIRLGLMRNGRAAKLTEREVSLIKGMLLLKSTTIKAIGEVFHMSRRQLHSIKSGFAWVQVPAEQPIKSTDVPTSEFVYVKKRVVVT